MKYCSYFLLYISASYPLIRKWISIMLSLFFFSLCRHAKCQWYVCRSKRDSWHRHGEHFKIRVNKIMDFSLFCLYHRLTVRLLMHFNSTLKCVHIFSHFSANGIQSQSTTIAFHGALQINVVWLIGYFLNAFDSVFTCWTLTVLIGSQSQFSWSKSAQ